MTQHRNPRRKSVSHRAPQRQAGFRLAPLAMAVAGLFSTAPALAQSAPAFQSMVAMRAGMVKLPDGTMSKWSGAQGPVIGKAADGRDLMTIQQTQQKALLDWEKFELKANEILEFQQQQRDWIAVNRVHSNSASRIDGEIKAIGRVFILNDNGVLTGEGAQINTRQLVTGQGVSDVLVEGSKTTIVQSQERAILNWSDMSLEAGEALKFQQKKSDWIALNRSHLSGKATQIHGDIEADGHLLLVSREGLHLNGKIKAQQLVASSLDIRDSQFLKADQGLISKADDYNGRTDPTFSNSWKYVGTATQGANHLVDAAPEVHDANDPLRYGVTVGEKGLIETGSHGKVMLFGPHVTNKGEIRVRDEGQIVLAAGDNIYLSTGTYMAPGVPGKIDVYAGVYNPLGVMRSNLNPRYYRPAWRYGALAEGDVALLNALTVGRPDLRPQGANGESRPWAAGDVPGEALAMQIIERMVPYLDNLQSQRAETVGFHARNEGLLSAKRGGWIDFRGFNLEQMGIVDMTSTALFRGAISFTPVMWDYWEYANGDSIYAPFASGNGHVVFGKGSLTQITPDLDSNDRIAVSEGAQSVGSLTINARSVHMQEDALIHMPSGSMKVLLDAGVHVFSNRGNGANTDNEDGTRFLMDRGATIDLSGWETTLEMGYHQVTGKLFAAQLKDSPLQRDGALYRKEIKIDRRYGTDLADWQSFDNLNQGKLAQFLTNGGSLTMDIGDDFIMKQGSVIDVSGGKTIYKDGYVETTLLRRLDGTLIDVRAADPDELYMGLANEWVVYDPKWRTQKTYRIPLLSNTVRRYETSYEHGGKGGSIEVLAPDVVLQGTLKGETTAGRYQRGNAPAGGVFKLNNAGESEAEYVSHNVLIAAIEQLLPENFGVKDKLTGLFITADEDGGAADLFQDEFDHDLHTPGGNGDTLRGHSTVTSADFFNRSSMGSYSIHQRGRVDTSSIEFPPLPGNAVKVEQGAHLQLAHGASLTLFAGDRMQFLGSVRTEGGDVSLSALSLQLGEDSVIDTRGSWYSDYERDEHVPLLDNPRIHGGDISLIASGGDNDGNRLILPETMVIDASGGGWVDRKGKLKGGKGGNLSIGAGGMGALDEVDLGGLDHARAYGLGGNGGFSFTAAQDIHIGDAPPADDPAAFLLRPEFFENSGFSSIALDTTGRITLHDGVELRATSASLQLHAPALHDPNPYDDVPSAYYAPSGTDIYDISRLGYVPVEQRPAALRNGMALSFTGDAGVNIGEQSVLATEAGGSLALVGKDVSVRGTLLAPAGEIQLQAGTTAGQTGAVVLHENARLLAPGVSWILKRGVDGRGREVVDGVVLDGGRISLGGQAVTIGDGVVLDVAGTSATFDLVTRKDGTIVRQARDVASDGGLISISGTTLDIDRARFQAQAGGSGARGGGFVLSWTGDYGLQRENPWAPTPESVYDSFGWYFDGGILNDVDGNPVTSFFGTDLSRIDWNIWGMQYDFDFAPGFSIGSLDELVSLLKALDAAALGEAPLLMVGDQLPPAAGGGGGGPQAPHLDAGLRALLEQLGGYEFVDPVTGPSPVTRLSTSTLAAGGFSDLTLNAAPGILFVGNATLGGYTAAGEHRFDRINLNAGLIMGQEGADVRINAGIVTLDTSQDGGGVDMDMYGIALADVGVHRLNPQDTSIRIEAGNLLQVGSADFYGYTDVLLASGGDLRLKGADPVSQNANATLGGAIHAPGRLTLKADQIYAATARHYTVKAGDTLTILPQDAGTPINSMPLEGGATLTLTAPRIVQGGTLRSPLGTINLIATDDGSAGAGTVTLLPGSLTSVSGTGGLIPYGTTSNGDTWIDPVTGLELTQLPAKAVNLTGETLDLQEGAELDVQGGGDLYAWEFTPGIGGSTDWLTGYRNGDYDWVADGSEIYAVLPGYDADIAPVGIGNAGAPRIGEKIWLSGGSGLAAGYYTLLPARYALLPGAFRVSAQHHYGDYAEMLPGSRRLLNDGSSIQAGYRYIPGSDGAPKYAPARASGYLVMPGETLRMRSSYVESTANGFYVSEAFLKKALRSNRPLGEIPRIPLDGGSVVIDAGRALTLDATLRSAAAKGGRGGFADIKGEKILVAGTGTDLALYDGYLVLDAERLTSFGAESLLLGGVRQQGEANLEIEVGASDIVIDNRGSVLSGPELLFAATGRIEVKDGATVETAGQISGSSGDLRLRPGIDAAVDDKGNTWEGDDEIIHGALDQGALLRLSSSEQVNILRNIEALDAMAALVADPAELARVNAGREALGLAPIVPTGGELIVADGARLGSSRSIALDATRDTRLAPGATLTTKQISASASRVSVGNVPAGTEGLVFAGGSLGALAAAEDILLKSYSSIDFHGAATLRADGRLALDSRQVRVLDAGDGTVTIAGEELALTNTSGGTATAALGSTRLLLEGRNIYLEGQDKWLSGVGHVDVKAAERVIGRDAGTLYVPDSLTLEAGALTADSGAQLRFDAQGDVRVRSNGNAKLPAFSTLGATLGITGRNVINEGAIGLTGGTVNLRARGGDVRLAAGSSIDVTSSVSRIFDVEVGVGGGIVNLVSDSGNVDMAEGAVIDVSGTEHGGDAGALTIQAGLGDVRLDGEVRGDAAAGARSGSFSMLSRTMGDFAALNAQLDAGGFRQARRFEVNQGDVDVTGTVRVQEFAVVANDGAIKVGGTIETVGDDGGRIQLSASEDVVLASGGKLIARAKTDNGSGGTVFLETVGRNDGRIQVQAGSTIDVSGSGEGGRSVRLRAPQIDGNDVAIAPVAGNIVGARSVIAEGFRAYEDVAKIDQSVIDRVSADAVAFMTHAAAIRGRLGAAVTVAPGIELRSDGDMELVQDWDLHTLRFGDEQSAGVLTLRAGGDLLINANLSDGFDGATADAALVGGDSWTLNLTAGANTSSPDSLAVLPLGQLADGKGSLIVGGTPDTTEYYLVALPDGSVEHRLFRKAVDGSFLRDGNEYNPYAGYFELERDAATGQYIDPVTGALIDKDPVTGDYADTLAYGRMPLPEVAGNESGYGAPSVFYEFSGYQDNRYGQGRYAQWDNSTGYLVRTGTAGINLATGRDLVLKYRPSVIYTAGESAPDVDGFQAPTRLPLGATDGVWGPMTGYYTRNGGDLYVRAQGDIVGSASNQLPTGWLWRYGVIDQVTGEARENGSFSTGREREQLTWFVRFDRYQAGIGALGGGNIDVAAGGDIVNLSVNIPNTGRVSGGYDGVESQLHLTGGGNLALRAGGDIGTIRAYVADGTAQLTAGGGFTSTDRLAALRQEISTGLRVRHYDLYSMLFTSSGRFRLQSGGDLNLDVVADPFAMGAATDNTYGGGGTYGPGDVMYYIGASYGNTSEFFTSHFYSYTPEASVELFSAGGDVKIWNNYGNAGVLNKLGGYMKPLHIVSYQSSFEQSLENEVPAVWPATVSAVAAAGSVEVKGGMVLAPSPTGNLSLLARRDVLIGPDTVMNDPFAYLSYDSRNYFPGFDGIHMSQTKPEHVVGPLRLRASYGQVIGTSVLTGAGVQGQIDARWDSSNPPDLHAGDALPARIYAADGDVITTKAINLPKQMWVQAGRHVYFPNYTIQHNNPNDLSLLRAGDGLYFAADGQVYIYGPGRLEIETGRDFWIPSNGKGIVSQGITLTDLNPYDSVPAELWHPDQNAADIAISTGFNQQPDYDAFVEAYLDPERAADIAQWLLADAGEGRELPAYLFDRLYARGNGSASELVSPELAAGFVNYMRSLEGLPPLASAEEQTAYLGQAWAAWLKLPAAQSTPYDRLMPRMTEAEVQQKRAMGQDVRPEFYLSERREGLVNYVRRLQGLEALDTQAEQLAYLDTAWAYWEALDTDFKTPLIRNVLFTELRTTGREANDADSARNGATFRGYDAIAKLFPGAQKRVGEELAQGESRWTGDFETFASRVLSRGGGKVEFVMPGGGMTLANVAAKPQEVGQPWTDEWGGGNPRGDALRAGVITENGGEINIFARSSVTVNESRILTTKGGNVMVWSSYGDIAAGKGAKTSISPQFYDYATGNWVHVTRTPAGLPTGAGIGTLASQPGSPPADVDLIAPNGIVDAGDAGLRVSGNFNVFALQILGTDNIDVTGISTGLPLPPAAPPTSLAVDDAAAKGARVQDALLDAVKKVQDNSAIKGPSLIEVRVLGFGSDCAEGRENCEADE